MRRRRRQTKCIQATISPMNLPTNSASIFYEVLLFSGALFYFFDILILNCVSCFILIFAQLYTIAATSIGFSVIFLLFTRLRFTVNIKNRNDCKKRFVYVLCKQNFDTINKDTTFRHEEIIKNFTSISIIYRSL
jgi:hypothetical protein